MDNGKLEIVDGSQRLRTLKEYILDGFELGQLEELPSLAGDVLRVRNRAGRAQLQGERPGDTST
jgi:hypothetical protein